MAALWLTAVCVATAQDGVPLWTNRYAGGASAIAVDSSGNVFVTGGSSGSLGDLDYGTLAYSAAGVPLWTNRYGGPSNGGDIAYAVAVDSSGNVIVTGISDSTSNSDYDYVTIKYSSGGEPLWTNRYHGPGYRAAGTRAVAVDNSGNIFVTAFSSGSSGDLDYATLAYSAAGVPLWTNRYNGPGNLDDYALPVAVDGGGNVVVSGSAYSSDSGYDFTTIKYSGAGVPLWTNRYSGPGNFDDQAEALAVDGNGNIVVTGFSRIGSRGVYATIKYSASGVPLWTNYYDGGGGGDNPSAIAVDSSGNVFVTGHSYGSFDYNYATVAYSGAGVPLWTNSYQGPGHLDDSAIAIGVDGKGDVFVTGTSGGDYLTFKYSSAGVPLWTNRYNGGYAYGLAVDRSGNVFVTGSSSDGSVTIKYSGASLSPIPLNHQIVGNQLVLSWTNAAFVLQSAPITTGIFTNIPNSTSPFTNVVSGAQQYFRLKAN